MSRFQRPNTLQWIGGAGEVSPAPFARARLENGVRVLIRPNSAIPVVAVDCWIGVGALQETDEHAGISHFLEHMFFKGTRRFPLGSMDRLVKEMGGYNNAATSMEYTHYYIVVPGEHVWQAADLLADHLADPALPAEELERERVVIKEEIRRKDDSPHGRLYTALTDAAYGTSPYAREVLGKPDSLDRIDPAAMREWWRSNYTGDRIVVAIAGDVDAEQAIVEVASRFGGLPPGSPAPAAPEPPAVVPKGVDVGMDVAQGYLAWGFPMPGRDDLEALCALEVAATILGDGETSRLHRRLIDELRLVTEIGAWTYGLERSGLLGVSSVCGPDRREAVEGEIAEALDAAVRHGVSLEEVRRAQTILAADFAYDNETNAALTGTLGEFETLYGAAEAYRDVLRGVAAVTPERVGQALSRWVSSDRAVRAWVGPNGT
ncbi:MAG TPA: pitrilysin family protein [Gemmatimonadota bacterium]|nr:pitrilysin family protein [Gemmatimonadota bacterium]